MQTFSKLSKLKQFHYIFNDISIRVKRLTLQSDIYILSGFKSKQNLWRSRKKKFKRFL